MKDPKLFDRYSLKRLTQGAIGGALLTVSIGFGLEGWYTGSGATKLSYQSAGEAEAFVLTPICAESFRAHATPEQLASLRVEPSYRRGDILKQVVKVPGPGAFNYLLINSCADAILAANAKSAANE